MISLSKKIHYRGCQLSCYIAKKWVFNIFISLLEFDLVWTKFQLYCVWVVFGFQLWWYEFLHHMIKEQGWFMCMFCWCGIVCFNNESYWFNTRQEDLPFMINSFLIIKLIHLCWVIYGIGGCCYHGASINS